MRASFFATSSSSSRRIDVGQDRVHAPVMRRLVRDQRVSLALLALFLAALAGQAVAGWHGYNNLETWHAEMAGETPGTLSLGRSVSSSDFARAVTASWLLEYLQFTLFIPFTVWLIQNGSPDPRTPAKRAENPTRSST
jgi:hypothetical protein